MAMLTFQNIMEADDITEKVVPIPEWGGDVKIKSISHRKMREIKSAAGEDDIDEDFIEKQIILKGLVEPALTIEEVEMLFDKNTKAVTTILNSILGNSKEKKDAVKEEEKSIPDATE